MTHRNFSRSTRRVWRLVVVGSLTMLASCNWGPRPSNLEPAKGPQGTRVALRIKGEKRDRLAELFAVDSAGLLVLEGKLVRVKWSQVHAMVPHRFSSEYAIRSNKAVSKEHRARLALISRFPQGLSGPLLTRVLAELKQDKVEDVQ